MVCTPFKMPNGATGIMCSRGRPPRRKCCACGNTAGLQCDWPVPHRQSGTCDKYICDRCARVVGEDKHYCPFHRGEPQRDLFGETA